MKHYKFLEQVFGKIGNINSIINVLETSEGNFCDKIEHICTLKEIKHEILNSEMIGDMIQHSVANKAQLNDWEIANLNHIELIHKNSSAVPVELVLDLYRAQVKCKNSWVLFRNGDASIQDIVALLSDVVRLVSDIASIKAESLKISKYDVILGLQDSKLNTRKVDAIFTEIGAFFRQFITEVGDKQKHNKICYPKGINEEKQILLGYDALSSFGMTNSNIINSDYVNNRYSFGKDLPFLVNYSEDDYRIGLKTLFRKIGYALYALNLPEKWHKQPVGWNLNNILSEILGLLTSNHLMMSKEFVKFISPNLKKRFSFRGKVGHYENIQLYFNEVQPNLLMHKSDEVTLLAHIMLRYTLEKEMISDSLQVQDLPDAWIQGMKHYFNVAPKNDLEGFLQDDYWVSGIFGYFPCCMISAIIASQIFSTMKNTDVQVLSQVEKGDLSSFILWINKNVCDYSTKYSSMDLLKKVTGQKLNVNFYKNYLTNKYLNM
ncbi:carboxypeptidase Taq (M32) metallopeptidase family protein [Ehrlichia chaffeensis str. Heartland]|uniref:Metal-dependent carboxypeptidase n=1 Tax=Ehrlichia chaffeensis (strain ATCC CRL-10679 / Arkansas) TaxID=205920 RepID=Q2GH02_EHRCR|nr:carboxypeptidase [Ehrlichia chaffeensis]ABD45116.1 putative carboxypeptidase [Ehrlichia chaffeensis str. Arkansas]AHX03560.1 carboxypeptidase Taq (M32) metallopeptidase family protein [Ehrlichia chaffeensis str. Heartland]AHX05719.1 carboxypeptidase Taq (M32) metallopeptidase family protein [Ehrlichia chaffeensis str. Jax]AHX06711.1 carboxypeptidase Taq (M32) metallopeptidase family protein [Ehrlichia chaffeensis str. Liberty]AHX07146.1 carboxypeptidase Taq (M32) metallopeptidase family pro